MEIQLSSVNERRRVGAISAAASGARCIGLGTPARPRSMPGVGVYHVPAFWGLNTKTGEVAGDMAFIARLDQRDPFTYNFTNRQGPPTCSPPV
jgi:hypothetical protein